MSITFLLTSEQCLGKLPDFLPLGLFLMSDFESNLVVALRIDSYTQYYRARLNLNCCAADTCVDLPEETPTLADVRGLLGRCRKRSFDGRPFKPSELQTTGHRPNEHDSEEMVDFSARKSSVT